MDPTEHLHPLLSERLQFINLHLSVAENKPGKTDKADEHFLTWNLLIIGSMAQWDLKYHHVNVSIDPIELCKEISIWLKVVVNTINNPFKRQILTVWTFESGYFLN